MLKQLVPSPSRDTSAWKPRSAATGKCHAFSSYHRNTASTGLLLDSFLTPLSPAGFPDGRATVVQRHRQDAMSALPIAGEEHRQHGVSPVLPGLLWLNEEDEAAAAAGAKGQALSWSWLKEELSTGRACWTRAKLFRVASWSFFFAMDLLAVSSFSPPLLR